MTPERAVKPQIPRGRKIVLRIGAVVGALLMIAGVTAWEGVATGGSRISKGDTYVWTSGSRLFIDNNSPSETVSCVLGGEQNRWVTISPRSRAAVFTSNGAWVHQDLPLPVKVTCDHTAAISSGPLLVIYPLAATPIPLVAGLILLVFWHVGTGGRGGQWFFGPRDRLGLERFRPPGA